MNTFQIIGVSFLGAIGLIILTMILLCCFTKCFRLKYKGKQSVTSRIAIPISEVDSEANKEADSTTESGIRNKDKKFNVNSIDTHDDYVEPVDEVLKSSKRSKESFQHSGIDKIKYSPNLETVKHTPSEETYYNVNPLLPPKKSTLQAPPLPPKKYLFQSPILSSKKSLPSVLPKTDIQTDKVDNDQNGHIAQFSTLERRGYSPMNRIGSVVAQEKKLFIRIDEAEFNVESLGDIIASAKTQIERDRLHTI